MERIDLFDKYIKGELSETERSEFRSRMESDEDFASEFNVYMLTVSGIRKEAQQDNLDFGAAMKGLSKDELFDIIGRKPKVLYKDDIAAKLKGRYSQSDNMTELSGMAALDNSDDDEFEMEPSTELLVESENNKAADEKKGSSMRTFTLIFIGIIILLILIGLLF